MTEDGSGEPVGKLRSRLRALYSQRPVLAWGGTAVVAGVVLAVVVIVLVGRAAEPANVAINCSVYDSDGSVRLTLRGKVTQKEAESGCDGIAAKLSGEGRYWRVGTPALPENEPRLACTLDAPAGEGFGVAIVEDNPQSFSGLGTSLCGELAHDGWTQAEALTGPWQHEYDIALQAEEAVETEEQEIREEEQAELERREQVIYRCEEKAQAAEEVQLEAIESETEARMEGASESREYEIEDEGWAKEEEAWERGEAAIEACNQGDE